MKSGAARDDGHADRDQDRPVYWLLATGLWLCALGLLLLAYDIWFFLFRI